MPSWGYIFYSPGCDPATDRMTVDRQGLRSTMVASPDRDVVASQIAVELVESGAEFIELCGAFGITGAAHVMKAVNGRVPVLPNSAPVEAMAGMVRIMHLT